MTEDEAKQKACIGMPALVQATLISGADRHVHVQNTSGYTCRGSACMGWVESEPGNGDCSLKNQPALAQAVAAKPARAPKDAEQ